MGCVSAGRTQSTPPRRSAPHTMLCPDFLSKLHISAAQSSPVRHMCCGVGHAPLVPARDAPRGRTADNGAHARGARAALERTAGLYLSERVQDQQDWYATKSDAT